MILGYGPNPVLVLLNVYSTSELVASFFIILALSNDYLSEIYVHGIGHAPSNIDKVFLMHSF